MTHILRVRPASVAMAAWLALLSACGGGGDNTAASDSVSQDKAQTMSADSSALSTDGTDGSEALLSTMQTLVASASANVTVGCGGGGTAMFSVTGNPGTIGNGQLDAGEAYAVTFTNCRGSAGAVMLNGTATLTVNSAGGGVTSVSTSTQNLQVTLPLRTLTYNGSSTFSQTVVTNGAMTTTTNHWVSPQIVVKSVRNGTLRTSTFTLSNVDMTRTFTRVNGVLTATSFSGTHTMDAVLPNASWSITTATQGAVTCDANGVPTQGSWTITLPNDRIGISVVPGTLTVTVDFGADGTIDRTFVFSTATLMAGAD